MDNESLLNDTDSLASSTHFIIPYTEDNTISYYPDVIIKPIKEEELEYFDNDYTYDEHEFYKYDNENLNLDRETVFDNNDTTSTESSEVISTDNDYILTPSFSSMDKNSSVDIKTTANISKPRRSSSISKDLVLKFPPFVVFKNVVKNASTGIKCNKSTRV